MKIKIISCSDPLFWYNRHLSEVFDVYKTDLDRYWTREKDAYKCLNFVLFTDCEVIKEED